MLFSFCYWIYLTLLRLMNLLIIDFLLIIFLVFIQITLLFILLMYFFVPFLVLIPLPSFRNSKLKSLLPISTLLEFAQHHNDMIKIQTISTLHHFPDGQMSWLNVELSSTLIWCELNHSTIDQTTNDICRVVIHRLQWLICLWT